ncbi:NlpC/P60 family protein [Apilactobacillus micheneri]|uniref:NlpC/P60 family protein n=1 Tax=Apilactobacillus micheneri TaxID=1899430 RepID=A0A9Q8MTM1_9LACO|nr:C40 family peptidase [Apilactobacillus micheneri]TPR39829.1 NlpC/P60 family protein [Apilactobacillus micheneri]TPR43750.1 NlpC/P60 family protein [Apilactobacillus micheneri]TPR45303.1 NlpC/P60 family protein [Apilactobacillus micheneri]
MNIKYRNNLYVLLSTIVMTIGFGVGFNCFNVSASNTTYNKPYHMKKVLYHTKYNYYNAPNQQHKVSSAKHDYKKKFKLTRIAKSSPKVTYVKTKKGWINHNAFAQWVTGFGHMNYSMQVSGHNADLYNQPKNTKGYRKIATTESLGLLNKWITVNGRAETNAKKGYYRFNYDGQNYYIASKYLKFNLNGLTGNNYKIEKAFKAGYKFYGKSPYAWGKGRTLSSVKAHHFDCSSFVHYIYSKAGIHLGSMSNATTFSLRNMGKPVNYKHMKRGDIFFFNDKSEGSFCHVGFYLGNGLFMHDSPSADTGGVGISSLKDPHWSSRFNHTVRRIVY